MGISHDHETSHNLWSIPSRGHGRGLEAITLPFTWLRGLHEPLHRPLSRLLAVKVGVDPYVVDFNVWAALA